MCTHGCFYFVFNLRPPCDINFCWNSLVYYDFPPPLRIVLPHFVAIFLVLLFFENIIFVLNINEMNMTVKCIFLNFKSPLILFVKNWIINGNGWVKRIFCQKKKRKPFVTEKEFNDDVKKTRSNCANCKKIIKDKIFNPLFHWQCDKPV